jgi:hypothetical protein
MEDRAGLGGGIADRKLKIENRMPMRMVLAASTLRTVCVTCSRRSREWWAKVEGAVNIFDFGFLIFDLPNRKKGDL